MARLPGIADLGAAPTADPTRPLAAYDTSPLARGAQSIAASVEGFGKGTSALGSGIGAAQVDSNRWDYAKAHADFLARKTDLDAQTALDNNYGPDASGKTLPERYEAQLKDIHNQSAALISDPAMRERFTNDTQPQIADGRARALVHATTLQREADVGYVSQQGDNFINKAINTTDDRARTQLIDSYGQLVDGLVAKGAITPEQGVARKKSWAQQYATADLLARSDTDPMGVINELRAKPGSPEQIDNRIVEVEGSGSNPASSAAGTGQFTNSTWLDVLKRNRPDLAQGRSDDELLALRADKQLGHEMVGRYREENTKYLQGQGLPTTAGNLYLAHFLGPAGAAAVLRANPNMPASDALAKALGPEKAAAMVAANPQVLQGQLAGSVAQWASDRMGGVGPGGGRIYDLLPPDRREQLLSHALLSLNKHQVTDTATFHNSVVDDLSEADRTGSVAKPKKLEDFIGTYGPDRGSQEFKQYQANLTAAADKQKLLTMSDTDIAKMIESYNPKPGEGYTEAAQRQDALRKAATTVLKARADDPAGYAVSKLPVVQQSYQNLSKALADPTAKPEAKQAAARDYVTKTMLEQQRIGIAPADQRIVPQAYVDHLTDSFSNAATSDEAGARTALVSRVQQEAALWGENWPSIMRELSPKTQPIVRAIAAGADPVAMTRLLSLDPKADSPSKVLREQNETKFGDLQRSLNDEFAPFLRSLVGRQKERDYTAYYSMGQELAALYVRDGKSAGDAARQAFTDLVGGRYDFRDTWRLPKSAGVAADDVQRGTEVARDRLEQLGVRPAVDDGGITDARSASFTKFGRDGVFVTAPDNSGLNLAYGDKFVRGEDGSPLLLPWNLLAAMSKQWVGPEGGLPASDAIQQEALTEGVGAFISRIFGPTEAKFSEVQQPASAFKSYPTDEDAEFARRAGFGYGTAAEPYIRGNSARVLGVVTPKPGKKSGEGVFTALSAEGQSLSSVLNAINDETRSRNVDLTKPENKGLRYEIGSVYAKAALVVNALPIAQLGFDPKRVVLDTKLTDATIGGGYSPKLDSIYSNLTSPGTLVHESIHRGLELLRQRRPDLAPVFNALPNEEYIVRYLMATRAGNPEEGRGDIADKQRRSALAIFNDAMSDTHLKNLAILERAAQEEIAKKHPGGPR